MFDAPPPQPVVPYAIACPGSTASPCNMPRRTRTNGPVPTPAATERALLRNELVPYGKLAGLHAIVTDDGYRFVVGGVSAGTLQVTWTAGTIRLGSGLVTFTEAGAKPVTVRLSKPGRRLLRDARAIQIAARATFVPARAPARRRTRRPGAIIVTRRFKLGPRPR